jgi:hypothetical protein
MTADDLDKSEFAGVQGIGLRPVEERWRMVGMEGMETEHREVFFEGNQRNWVGDGGAQEGQRVLLCPGGCMYTEEA